jgi:hypothetical protein
MRLNWMRAKGRSLIHLADAAIGLRSYVVEMPICKECQKAALGRGNMAAMVGLSAWLVAGLTLGWMGFTTRGPNDPVLIGVAITSVVSFVVGLIAVIVGALLQRSALQAREVAHIDDSYIWMRDVNANWLASLPEWQGKSFAEIGMK